MDLVKQALSIFKSAKAWFASAVAFASALLVLAADKDFQQIVPDNIETWLMAIASAIVVFGGVFGIRNQRTVADAEDDLRRAKANTRVNSRAKAAKKAAPPDE